MSDFITEDFLLQNDFAKTLYHTYAKDLPIIDYHCHLPPDDIARNRQFGNITQVWLYGDHYKWRAMRTLGINERFITGNGTDEEKFSQWAHAVPYTMRNPLYHWTHLELRRYFGIKTLLSPDTASSVYVQANQLLKTPEYSTRGLLKKMKVTMVGTTDDPIDTLEHHQAIRKDGLDTKVLPSFRPDKSFAVENPKVYVEYLDKLSAASGVTIKTFDNLLEALQKRVDFFHAQGGRLSDHGLEHMYYADSNAFNVESLFQKLLQQQSLTIPEIHFFKYTVLLALGKMYHQKGWVQQFHIGALRNTNTRMLSVLGPDTGFDSIGDFSHAQTLAKFLNELDKTNQLTKTILYNLNPADNEVMGTMVGNFNDGSSKGKVQFGSAWWFLDQKDGMEKQVNALSNLGLLSCFIGMLTDSRSFLSFPRHEYFRRILCNLIGNDVKKRRTACRREMAR